MAERGCNEDLAGTALGGPATVSRTVEGTDAFSRVRIRPAREISEMPTRVTAKREVLLCTRPLTSICLPNNQYHYYSLALAGHGVG